MVNSRKTLTSIFAAAAVLMMIMTILPLSLTADASSEYAEVFEAAQTRTNIYKVALMDDDFYDSDVGCLTKSQETQLLSLMQETADAIKCNIGIVITSDLHYMSDKNYVKNFHGTMFGEYSDSISLLLLNTHGNSAYARYEDQIYYTDRAYDLFNKRLNSIFDRLYVPLDKNSNDFYGACAAFCAALKSYGSGAGLFVTKFNINFSKVMTMIIAGTIMSIIIVGSFTRGYKRKTPISAAHYIDKNRTRINRQVDQFVREYTTTVHIQSSSGGGSHRSGGGGGHRSGGGGGRHR